MNRPKRDFFSGIAWRRAIYFYGANLNTKLYTKSRTKYWLSHFYVKFRHNYSKASPGGDSSCYDQMRASLVARRRSCGIRPADDQLDKRSPRASSSEGIDILEGLRNLKEGMREVYGSPPKREHGVAHQRLAGNECGLVGHCGYDFA
jgi:hypothetical protein